jgi:diguanylate cyclase (GGDEF)-like protein
MQHDDPQSGTLLAAATVPTSIEFHEALLRAIHEASPMGILVVNEHAKIVSHNQRFLEVWRICESGFQNGASVVGSDDAPILALVVQRVKNPESFVARVRELYQNPEFDDHCEIDLLDGRTLERQSTALRAGDGKYLGRVWFFRDVTSQKQAQARLLEVARLDPLTEVANRRYLRERAGQEFARARRLSALLTMLAMDIDHFKRVNDTYGHAAGDHVLKSFCRTTAALLRPYDVLGRTGGEEFVVVLPDTCLDVGLEVAERVRASAESSRLKWRGEQIVITVSIGITQVQPSDPCLDDVFERADRALYAAKFAGRNRVQRG